MLVLTSPDRSGVMTLTRSSGETDVGLSVEYFLNTPWGYLHLLKRRRNLMQEALGLSIDGMHCGACVRRVTDALGKIDGVEVNSVEVGSARMTFDPERVTVEKIAGAVNKIGFAVRGKK
jgi:copper chaperone